MRDLLLKLRINEYENKNENKVKIGIDAINNKLSYNITYTRTLFILSMKRTNDLLFQE